MQKSLVKIEIQDLSRRGANFFTEVCQAVAQGRARVVVCHFGLELCWLTLKIPIEIRLLAGSSPETIDLVHDSDLIPQITEDSEAVKLCLAEGEEVFWLVRGRSNTKAMERLSATPQGS